MYINYKYRRLFIFDLHEVRNNRFIAWLENSIQVDNVRYTSVEAANKSENYIKPKTWSTR